MLSLPGWDPNVDRVTTATGDDLAASLDNWITAQLVETYGLPRRRAHRLVSDHWVLPVLDGLDEMDRTDRPARPRASAVVRALNAHGRRPVVLVCRRADYTTLATSHGNPGEAPILQDAQQIILQDLTYPQMRDYLTYRFPDPAHPGGIQPRWQPVLHALAAEGSPLSGVLRRPWQLFLAISAYHARDTDPAELLQTPVDQLTDFLLAKLIPATTSRRPRPGRHRGHYDPQQVHTWLATLAWHLKTTSIQRGWSPTNLHLDDLWPIAGWRTPRYLTAALAAIPRDCLKFRG